MRQLISASLILTLASMLFTGCMERKERLSIKPDGSVAMTLEFAADSFDELFLGDAVPRIEGGWLAVENVVEDDDGKKTFTLKAEATFASGAALPADYAAPTDAFPETVLYFPTTVTVEERRDGTYYHFHRLYTLRPWAPLEAARQDLETKVSSVQGRDFEELPIQEQAHLMQALAEFGAVQLRHFAREAFLDVSPDAPQDHWLAISGAIDESLKQVDPEYLANLVIAAQAEGEADDAEAALQHEMELMENGATEYIKQAMQRTGWHTVGRFNEFLRRLERHRTYHDITTDLGDDEFEIVLTMPGEIVGHNGDSKSGNTVTWAFKGDAIRDRPLELMASSRRR